MPSLDQPTFINPNPIPQYILSICYLWINFKQKYNLWSHIIFINWILSWMDMGKKFITVNIYPDLVQATQDLKSPLSLLTNNKSFCRKLQSDIFATFLHIKYMIWLQIAHAIKMTKSRKKNMSTPKILTISHRLEVTDWKYLKAIDFWYDSEC